MAHTEITSCLRYLYLRLLRDYYQVLRLITGLPVVERSRITPNLFVGGQFSKRGFNRLRSWGITGVVSLQERKPEMYMQVEGVEVLHLPTPDKTAPTISDLQEGVKFIKKQIEGGGKVYVHCLWGEGRAPTMAIAYLISTGLTLEDAVSLVKKTRYFIKPTKGQMKVLEDFEKKFKLYKTST
jgi:hypothetical protein